MGTDLVISRRAQLAGYAGLAGGLRGRAKPIAVIAAVDVLAVALAFGAMHITGLMVSNHVPLPQLAPPAAAEPASVAVAAPPLPHLAPAARRTFAAMPDAGLMFAAPEGVAGGFTFAPATQSSTTTFSSPATVASAEPQPEASPAMPMPRPRPAERVAQRAAPVIDTADGSLDRLLLRDVAPVTRTIATVGGAALDTTAATVTQLASAAPAQPVVQSVTTPVADVVHAVAGLLN